MKDKDTTSERTRAKAVQGHTSSEFGESYLAFAVSFLEKGLERELAASFLQMLETEFRRIGLILDRETNELLCVIGQLIIGGRRRGWCRMQKGHPLRTVAQCPRAGGWPLVGAQRKLVATLRDPALDSLPSSRVHMQRESNQSIFDTRNGRKAN